MLSTMLYADEVVSAESIGGFPDGIELSDKEVAIAKQLVESLSAEWQPAEYPDTYRARVLDLIARKAEGREIVEAPVSKEAVKVDDLMAALEASVAAAKAKVKPVDSIPSKSAGSRTRKSKS